MLMDELNGRMLACQILLTGVIARLAGDARDPVAFLSEFRDEIRAVIGGVRISGGEETSEVRRSALASVDELFSLMKPPSRDE
jgi:hypothetical protein